MTDPVYRESRRSFLEKAIVGGVALSLPTLSVGTVSAAPAVIPPAFDDLSDCLANCYISYWQCRTAAKNGPGWAQPAAYAACYTAYTACQAGCYAAAAANTVVATASSAAQWIADNPTAVVGTVVVIGLVTFVVVSGGAGAPALIPLAAL